MAAPRKPKIYIVREVRTELLDRRTKQAIETRLFTYSTKSDVCPPIFSDPKNAFETVKEKIGAQLRGAKGPAIITVKTNRGKFIKSLR